MEDYQVSPMTDEELADWLGPADGIWWDEDGEDTSPPTKIDNYIGMLERISPRDFKSALLRIQQLKELLNVGEQPGPPDR